MNTSTSSSRPASRHCFATFAPRTFTYLSPAAALARSTALGRSVQNVMSAGGSGGGRWVSTTTGPWYWPPNAPSLSVPRLGSSPPKVLWPTRIAPTSASRRATVALSPPSPTKCSVSQDMSPPGPAMKPSSDIVAEYSSLVMGLLSGSRGALADAVDEPVQGLGPVVGVAEDVVEAGQAERHLQVAQERAGGEPLGVGVEVGADGRLVVHGGHVPLRRPDRHVLEVDPQQLAAAAQEVARVRVAVQHGGGARR